MIRPDDPDSTLVLWRGLMVGALVSIDVSVTYEGRARVILVRRRNPEEGEEARKLWAEIAASGVIVQERS